MKKLLNYLAAMFLLLTTSGLISAQDFTVKIKSTDAYSGYIKPIKAGGSHQFQIEVKNNRLDTCTVSIVKSVMGELESWITIDNNSQSLFPAQSKNFNLTINVPGSAGDFNYPLWLSFNAYDKDGFNHSFQYYNQTIIVDNSKPIVPTFSISQTGNTITAHTVKGYDERSAWYTSKNFSSGYNGIRSFKIVLTKPDNTKIIKSINPINVDSHKFTSLAPNTTYIASVTAIDLVGNSKTSEKLATTAPAAPTGLSFSNTTYISTILTWNVSAGASGYDIYKVTGSTHTKVNSSPVTENAFLIQGLEPNTNYTFNVIALSNVGSSGRSANADVTTTKLPNISGSNTVCSGSTTFSVPNLISGYAVSWNKSSKLKLLSQSGASAAFLILGNGSAWVDASIITPSGQLLELNKKSFWIGKPDSPTTTPSGYPTFEMQLWGMQRINLNSHGASAISRNWWLSGNSVQIINTYDGRGILVEAVNIGLTNFYVTTSNICGASATGGGLIKVSRNGGGLPMPLSITPNPGNSFVNLDFTPEKRKRPAKYTLPIFSLVHSFAGYETNTHQAWKKDVPLAFKMGR